MEETILLYYPFLQNIFLLNLHKQKQLIYVFPSVVYYFSSQKLHILMENNCVSLLCFGHIRQLSMWYG